MQYDASLFNQQHHLGIPWEQRREVYLAQLDTKQGRRITQLRDGSIVFLQGKEIKHYIPIEYTYDFTGHDDENNNDQKEDFFRIYQQELGYADIEITGFEVKEDAVLFATRYRDACQQFDPNIPSVLLIKNMKGELVQRINV